MAGTATDPQPIAGRGDAVLSSTFNLLSSVPANWRFPGQPDEKLTSFDPQSVLTPWECVQALDGVPQDPRYHGEGDVLTHTLMVMEALMERPQWPDLSPVEQHILFAAALWHDIGKATCTRIEADGTIISPKHAMVGAQLARQMMWENDDRFPFPVRELIVQLIRHHGLPIWFMDKPDPLRSVLACSGKTRMNWLAILAESDVRGRISPDQEEWLTRIECFQEFCEEHGCLSDSYPFPNEHSRFRYFHGLQRSPSYAAYGEPSFEVTLLSGLPAAGKDTWIQEHGGNTPVISLDEIRQEKKISPADSQQEVIRIAKDRARQYLRSQTSFIWNATNVTKHLRKPLIQLFSSYGAKVRIIYIDAPLSTIRERNRRRNHPVPECVIERLAQKLEVPSWDEAHQVIWIY